MDAAAVTHYITTTFDKVETSDTMGYTFFFYDSDHKLPFATLIAQDNEYDRVSSLDRPGVFRLNIGVDRDTYHAMFGPPPSAPGESGIVDTGHDFTALDQIMPHPVYAPQMWVCVLSPSAETFETVKRLLAEGYDRAARRNVNRPDAN
jgi:hypothetical protein